MKARTAEGIIHDKQHPIVFEPKCLFIDIYLYDHVEILGSIKNIKALKLLQELDENVEIIVKAYDAHLTFLNSARGHPGDATMAIYFRAGTKADTFIHHRGVLGSIMRDSITVASCHQLPPRTTANISGFTLSS